MSRPIKVFFSYSHKDEALRDQLAAHLATLQRKKVIDAWHDRKILPGSTWAEDIDNNLNSADIILLLISPDFLNSDYCSVTELEQAMERHEAGQACVIPVILRHSDWHDEPFAKLQALPKNAKPIVTWSDQDEAFLDVVRGIRSAIQALLRRQPKVTQAEIIDRETTALTTEIKKSGQGETQYRDEVLFCLKQDVGEISAVSRVILNSLQESLALSSDRATAIESEVARPFQIFRQTVIDLNVRSITPEIQARLDRLQKTVKLSDEDATAIVDSVLSKFSLPKFEFEFVTVNAQGQEINRQRKQAEYFVEDLGDGVALQMVSIPAGEFLMGSPESEEGRSNFESPQHSGKVRSFFMGKFTVTQEQWAAVTKLPKVKIDLNSDPSKFKGAKRPVEQVSWFEAVEFCDRLSQKTGRVYRLPSEAEWEYACRAGTKTPFYFGETITNDLANFDGKFTYAFVSQGKYLQQTTEVGSSLPNAFGLYDMHGNVWEWCLDHWHENYTGAPTDGSGWLSNNDTARRQLRGGSWFSDPQDCRSAYRGGSSPASRDDHIGFRVVCCAPQNNPQ